MIRFHGNSPCPIAVVHGGPGGIGSAAALAEELRIRLRKSVAEPLQSQNSIHALTDELCTQIQQPELENPLLLIGHSWGAWLAAFAAERCPERIRRLILIGCPPLRKKEGMEAVRLGRLPQDSRIRCRMLKDRLLRTRGTTFPTRPSDMMLRCTSASGGKRSSCVLPEHWKPVSGIFPFPSQ